MWYCIWYSFNEFYRSAVLDNGLMLISALHIKRDFLPTDFCVYEKTFRYSEAARLLRDPQKTLFRLVY